MNGYVEAELKLKAAGIDTTADRGHARRGRAECCSCGGDATTIDASISRYEGYKVTDCRADHEVDVLESEVGDGSARAYACSGGLGVLIQPDGRMFDYNASSDEPPGD